MVLTQTSQPTNRRFSFTPLKLALLLVLAISLVALLSIAIHPDWLHERPLNALTFHLVDWGYPTDRVSREREGRSSDWPLNPPLQPFEFKYSHDGKTFQFQEFLNRTDTTSILLLHNDQILAEEYFYLSRPSSRFLGHSLTKSVTSVLLGIAIEKGFIKNLDQSVLDFRPDLRGTAFESVRLRDLLNMTSGAEADEDWTKPESTISKFADAILSLNGSILSVVRTQKTAAPPGIRFNYATTDTQVLGWVIESATHLSLAQLNTEYLWRNLGAEYDAFYYLTFGEPQTAIGGGSFNSSTRDYGRFGLMVLREGVAMGKTVVSPQWLQMAPDWEGRKVGRLGKDYHDFFGYHKAWWILDNDGRSFCAWGVYGQFICIDRDAQIVMVKTSAFQTADSPAQEREIISFFKALAKSFR